MPTSCCVYSCKSRRKKGDSSIYFHRFPNDESMKENWLVAIKRTELPVEEIKNKVVCSMHFPKKMYLDRPGTYKPRLKPDAIPSIFNFAEIKTVPVRRGRRRKREPLAVALKRWGQKRNLEDPSYLPTKVIKREKVSPPREPEELPELSTPPPRRSGRPRKILIKRDPGESPPREVTKSKVFPESRVPPSKQHKVKKRFKNITELLESLKASRLISNEALTILLQHFSDIPLNIFQNSSNGLHNAFEEKVKIFALSLYYQSPRAYRFVRKRLKLPHPNRVKNWSFSCDYKPGLLSEVFEGLQQALQESPWMSDCVLLIDFMPLSKQSVWDEAREGFLGNVDYGACVIEAEELLASEALVIYLVGLMGTWKCPIAYFLVNKINSMVFSQLIRTCLDKLADVGYRAWSITLDEPLKNMNVIKLLGCNLITTVDNKHKISSSFKHPSRDYHIHIIFEYHNMLQLARNVLCELKSFRYEKDEIKWKYFTELHDLIEKGPECDSPVHLDPTVWHMHKMNVRLSRQTFSSEVADAIDWLRDTANHPEFQGSQVTTDFLRIMDSIYSILNERKYKETRCKEVDNNSFQDKHWWNCIIHKFIGYLVKLQSGSGKMFIQHERRQFIVGLIVTGNSLAAMANNLQLKTDSSEYFQSHKLSLDSLHVFFTYIRGNTGNNPTVLQFAQKLKEHFILSHCLAFEDFDSISKSLCLQKRVPLSDNYSFISGFEERVMQEMVLFLHDPLSEYKANVLNYIAGYISKVLLGKLGCSLCSALLIKSSTSITSLDDHGYSLYKPHVQHSKEIDLGGLIMASDDTVMLVRLAEKCFQLLVAKAGSHVILRKQIKVEIASAVLLTFVNTSSMPYDSHCNLYLSVNFSEPPHHLQLIKKVIDLYLTLRLQLYWL